MASTYLQRTPSTTGNRKKWTLSAWIKRSGLSSLNYLFSSYESSSTETTIRLDSSDQLDVFNWYGNTYNGRKVTNMRFRDTNAWYHIVVNLDLDNSTADDRLQIYVNGERMTSFSTSNNPTTGSSTVFNLSSINMKLGTYDSGNLYKFDGCMAHVHWVDGLQLDADTFGETDSTTGIWKPKTSPTISDYGTNGFFLDFADSSSMGNDVSGKNNDLTVNGTMTQTIDTPSNVFATMNRLDNMHQGSSFSNGNLTVQTVNSVYTWNTATFGVSKGKYYWEVKYDATSGSNYNLIGIADRPTINASHYLGSVTNTSNYGYYSDNGKVYAKSGTASTFGNSYSAGDIIGVALDIDNAKLYFSKNGTWQNSGVPTSGATGTGAVSIDAISSTTSGFYFPAFGDYGSTQNSTNSFNFGTGFFGTTAVASAGTNSGIGTFEYDVPSGYKALCTKNINAQEYS